MEEIAQGIKPEPKTLSALRPVLKNPVLTSGQERIVYEVYRGAGLTEDRALIKTNNIRYDITKIHPGRLGPSTELGTSQELPKTFGHYHRKIQNPNPPAGGQIQKLAEAVEVFEVISGKAWWLIQKYENEPEVINEVYLIEGLENEKIIILSGFGVTSINPEKDKELVLANFISLDTENVYEPYKNLQGACYYLTENEKGEMAFEKNPNYKEAPELIKLKPREIPELGISWSKPLYEFIKTPEKFDFLNRSEKFQNILTIENCYQIKG